MSTSITNGLMDLEISDIISTTNKLVNNITYDVWVHTPTSEYQIKYLKQLEYSKQYNTQLGDHIVINFMITGGTFYKDIEPYRDNLEITIKEVNSSTDSEYDARRYKLVLINHTGDSAGSVYTAMSREALDATFMIRVEAQCVPRELEALLAVRTGGVYNNMTLAQSMGLILNQSCKRVFVDGVNPTFRIDIKPPLQERSIPRLVIPYGIKALDVPSYIQNTNIGVYNGALGTYVTDLSKDSEEKVIYIYPLYDTDAFDNSTKKLAIYHANTSRLEAVENTYKQDGDLIKIMAGMDTKLIDDGVSNILSTGNTITYSDPVKLLNNNMVVTDDEVNYDHNEQMIAASLETRDDGLNKEIYTSNNSNQYKYRSELLRRSLAIYQVTWRFADISLLYPCMPVQFVYEDDELGIVKLNGTLQAVYSLYANVSKVTSAILLIAVESPSLYKARQRAEAAESETN